MTPHCGASRATASTQGLKTWNGAFKKLRVALRTLRAAELAVRQVQWRARASGAQHRVFTRLLQPTEHLGYGLLSVTV